MKNVFAPVLALMLALGFMMNAEAQISAPAPSPSAKVEQAIGLASFSLDYSRPAMRGRDIYGGLVPFDKIWRTGANRSTKISFDRDAKIGGKDVKAGTYAIYSMPGKDSWTIMLYSDLSLGGNVNGYDEKNEVTRFTVKPADYPMATESFTMGFNTITGNSANLHILWDKTIVNIPIELDTETEVMASIERTMAGPGMNDYRAAANYYANNGKDMDQALEWINKCLEMGGNERFWMVTDKARILAKMGKKEEAKKAAMMAMELAEKAGNNDYVKINQDIISGL
ncbi:MAG: DUF2911 domain-containing protein [Bacteroidota bacterium]